MSTIDTAEFKERLVEERQRLAAAAANLSHEHADDGSLTDETGELTGGSDNHMGDVATETFDRELDAGLQEGVEQQIEQIDAALGRIEDGSFGLCAVDGKPIPEERLRAVPWATLCIDHQRAREQG
jgi:RNA polymerase-binding transcription factor DksA